ncbi:MAG: hypothetical protein KKA54_10820 [Proteobacteria bacterium]|nr:hypothetical protein [Pseudomonadota bacterium]
MLRWQGSDGPGDPADAVLGKKLLHTHSPVGAGHARDNLMSHHSNNHHRGSGPNQQPENFGHRALRRGWVW